MLLETKFYFSNKLNFNTAYNRRILVAAPKYLAQKRILTHPEQLSTN